jgi:hypothetical protein
MAASADTEKLPLSGLQ